MSEWKRMESGHMTLIVQWEVLCNLERNKLNVRRFHFVIWCKRDLNN